MKKIILLIFLAFSLNAFAQQWTVKTPAPTARGNAEAAVVNGKIYVIGGFATSTFLTTVEEYDPVTDTWTTKDSMPTARAEFCVATVNGIIYAIGGYTGTTGTNVVEAYDPVTDSWTTKAPMPTTRSQISCGAINGKIYVVGGWPFTYNTLEVYDPAIDQWTTKSPAQVGREENNGAAVLNNQLYFIGGKNQSDTWFYETNEAYDPISDTWTFKDSMPQSLWNGGTTVLNNEIHFLGGSGGHHFPIYATHYVYNAISNSWTTALPMLHPRNAFATATLNGKIYVMGGVDTTNTVVNWTEEYSSGICYTYITVTDTLIINANLTGLSPVTYANSIKIFPNPTNDHITIDYGSNYTSLAGYTLKITNSLSQTVFTALINQPTSYINLSTWTGKGVYFVYLIDSNTNIVDIRKIVLQ